MTDPLEEKLEKAQLFFQRAEEVASTDNFNYAIDMYLEGLRLAPDALEDGHGPLRRMALIRQGKGGKKPSIAEKMKHMGGKTPLDEMLNAEFLMAKDPDNLTYAETFLKAAVQGGFKRTAEWIANLIFDANRAKDKPSFQVYILLKDCFKTLGVFNKSVAACRLASEMKPEDGPLQDELRDLSAQLTMQKGRYDGEGDFRKSIKDRELQEKMQSQLNTVKTEKTKEKLAKEARKQFEKDPSANNIIALAEALYDLDTDEGYKEAIRILEKSYKKYADFNFKRLEGEFRIRKLRSGLRLLNAVLTKAPGNTKYLEKKEAVEKRLQELFLEHFRLCAENYPTDMKMKYEYGKRLLEAGKYDEAIPCFQESRRDPRYKILAQSKCGECFYQKGWYVDAIDLFKQALNSCESQEMDIAKEIRYNLACSYEKDNQLENALELFRKLAQQDFAYKDVRERIDILRKNAHNTP